MKPFRFYVCRYYKALVGSNFLNNLKMSLVKRFFTRSKSSRAVCEAASPDKLLNLSISDDPKNIAKSATSIGKTDQSRDKKARSEPSKEDLKKADHTLNQFAKKYRRQEKHVTRLKQDAVTLEHETEEVVRLTNLSKLQADALDEEILNKRCDLKYLRSEAPEDIEAEIRKREPMYFKKFTHLKTSSEAKNLLTMLRQRQRALQHLELLVYNKYLDLQHDLKSDKVKRRTSHLMKDKGHGFGHLKRSLLQPPPQRSLSPSNSTNEAVSDSEAQLRPPALFSLVTSSSPSPVLSPNLFTSPVLTSML